MRKQFAHDETLHDGQLAAATPSDEPRDEQSGAALCEYRVRLSSGPNFRLEAHADCPFHAHGFEAAKTSEPYLTVIEQRSEPAKSHVSYLVDLQGLAAHYDNPDVATQVGNSLLSPASNWLLRPRSAPRNAQIRLHVNPGGFGFATGLKRGSAGSYTLRVRELQVATYSVFGEFRQREIELPGPLTLLEPGDLVSVVPSTQSPRARVSVVILDASRSFDDGRVDAWIESSVRAVANFYRGFPVERALLVVEPVAGRRRVLFGQVLPESAPGVLLRLGAELDDQAMEEDWILIHELFHLGFPSFVGEGKWLDEGFATYFEPLIRARMGTISSEQAWQEFECELPRGRHACETLGLARAQSSNDVYWGGALFAFLLDDTLRRESGGQRRLEHGLWALLARGGNASRVWSVERTLAVLGAELGGTVERLAARHRFAGAPTELRQRLRRRSPASPAHESTCGERSL